MNVVDTGKDLDAYAKVRKPEPAAHPDDHDRTTECRRCEETSGTAQVGCCTPATSAEARGVSACCEESAATVHGGLAALLRKYDVNEYAASVQVFALKGADVP
ncbi:MAG: hypothetical protein U0746_10260 [Gemmataceae bacterium]